MSDTDGLISIQILYFIYHKWYLEVDLKPWLEKCSKTTTTRNPWAAELT